MPAVLSFVSSVSSLTDSLFSNESRKHLIKVFPLPLTFSRRKNFLTGSPPCHPPPLSPHLLNADGKVFAIFLVHPSSIKTSSSHPNSTSQFRPIEMGAHHQPTELDLPIVRRRLSLPVSVGLQR